MFLNDTNILRICVVIDPHQLNKITITQSPQYKYYDILEKRQVYFVAKGVYELVPSTRQLQQVCHNVTV